MEGSWTVDKHDGEGTDDGSSRMGSKTTAEFTSSNSGNMTFKDDGTGSYKYNYDIVFDGDLVVSTSSLTITVSTQGSFKWSNGEESVTITYTSGDRNGESCTFQADSNNRKSQKWSGSSKQSYSMDGSNNSFNMDLIMELSKD